MIDLHLHTTRSDGRLAPAEMVRQAAQRGLRAIAITDHDVLDGLAEARLAGADLGVEVVAGIEMTARWDATPRAVHVLGYFVNTDDPALVSALRRARDLMAAHVASVLDAIRQAGSDLEAEHLDRYQHRYAGGAALVLGMLERGVLRRAPPGTGMRLLRLAANEPRAYTVAEAADLIHGAGGVVSLAHPSRLWRGRPLLGAADLAPLAEMGLDALEAWQWIPGGWGSEHYRRVAADLGLLVSGGSDDHGKRTADGAMRLGSQRVPVDVLEAIRARTTDRSARPDGR